MAVTFEGETYHDDRMFVVSVCKCTVKDVDAETMETVIYHETAPPDHTWCLVTYRNVPGYPVFRVDHFQTQEEARDRMKRVEPSVPLISLHGAPPRAPRPYHEFLAWKTRSHLQDFDYRNTGSFGGSNPIELVLSARGSSVRIADGPLRSRPTGSDPQSLVGECRSRRTTSTFQCPTCRRSSHAGLWESINADLDPGMREQVLNGRAFTFVCPSCGSRETLTYASLYHDPTRKFMVWWMPEANDMEEQDLARMNSDPAQMLGYRLRVVSTLSRLREKILIFEHQLDDRAVELLKRYIWSAFLEDEGFPRNQVYFSAANLRSEHPDIELVAFDGSGQGRGFTASGKNAYPRALEMLHGKFKVVAQAAPRWRVVDHTYWDLAEEGKG
jgi:hypothetical protein